MHPFDTKKNKSICVLPWVHEFIGTQGIKGPCCNGFQFKEGEDIDTLRAQMLAGEKSRVCEPCFRSEDMSGWSYRIKETRDWIKKFGQPTIENPSTQSIDIRFDTTCNLKCKTCGPESSTLWAKERGVESSDHLKSYDYFTKLDKAHLKKVYMAGGEPTYIPRYVDFLNELHEVNPNCEVMINTNLKRLPESWREIIKKFPNLSIICSCDAVGDFGRYIRYPLDWREFEDNVRFASDEANFFQFNLVASNLTTHRIHETCEWMKGYSKNINLSVLHRPEIFSEKAVPTEHRSKYISELEKLQKFAVGLYFAAQFRSEVNFLIKNYTDREYNKDLHEALVAEIKRQDRSRSVNLADVDPFLSSWISA